MAVGGLGVLLALLVLVVLVELLVTVGGVVIACGYLLLAGGMRADTAGWNRSG